MKYRRYHIILTSIILTLLTCTSCEDDFQEEGYYGWAYLSKTPQLYNVNVNGKYGYINREGDMVIQPQFDDCQYYLTNKIAWATDINGMEGYIDGKGNWVIQPTFKYCYTFSDGYANVTLNNGDDAYINKSGKIIFTMPEGYSGSLFHDGLIRFQNNDGDYGFYNAKGEIVIEAKYDYLYDLTEGLALFEIDNDYGYINKKDQILIYPEYDYAHFFHEGLASVRKSDKWGFINQEGEIIIDFQYDYAGTFFCGACWAEINDQYVIIDKSGNRNFVTADVKSYRSFSEDYASFSDHNGNWGFIDKKGKIVISPVYNNAAYFYGGIAYVEFENGSEGYINKSEDVVWSNSYTKSAKTRQAAEPETRKKYQFSDPEKELNDRLNLER